MSSRYLTTLLVMLAFNGIEAQSIRAALGTVRESVAIMETAQTKAFAAEADILSVIKTLIHQIKPYKQSFLPSGKDTLSMLQELTEQIQSSQISHRDICLEKSLRTTPPRCHAIRAPNARAFFRFFLNK